MMEKELRITKPLSKVARDRLVRKILDLVEPAYTEFSMARTKCPCCSAEITVDCTGRKMKLYKGHLTFPCD
jgi:hypothetical protein